MYVLYVCMYVCMYILKPLGLSRVLLKIVVVLTKQAKITAMIPNVP